MAKSVDLPGWAERRRLAFIERVLWWRGWINRRDLMEQFHCSGPQATLDLQSYFSLNPQAAIYNPRTRRYETVDRMEPMLGVPDLLDDSRELGGVLEMEEGVPFAARAEVPLRLANARVFRALARAVFAGNSVEIRYFSVHAGTVEGRRISPRAFGHDGLRWHVRALCHRDEVFKDFVVGRMDRVGKAQPCGFTDRVDTAWTDRIDLVLRPNPELPEVQRQALEMDYGMTEGKLVLSVRRAMEIYVRRRLGFIQPLDAPLPVLNELRELEMGRMKEEG